MLYILLELSTILTLDIEYYLKQIEEMGKIKKKDKKSKRNETYSHY